MLDTEPASTLCILSSMEYRVFDRFFGDNLGARTIYAFGDTRNSIVGRRRFENYDFALKLIPFVRMKFVMSLSLVLPIARSFRNSSNVFELFRFRGLRTGSIVSFWI
jgi:hypothetical protein